MKLSQVLFTVLLVGAGILIYDQVRSDATVPAAVAHDYLRADATPPRDELSADDPAPLASGGLRDRSSETRVEALQVRVAALERQLAALGQAPEGTPPAEGAEGTPLPELSETDVVGAENPRYDERTLHTIEAYVDEINRRKMEQQQKERIGGELDRLGVSLSDQQKEGVIRETMSFQTKARDLLRQGWPADEAGRDSRRKAFEGLQTEYATVINSLVPTAEAEKITSSRIARGMGLAMGGSQLSRFAGNRERGGSGGRRGDRGGD